MKNTICVFVLSENKINLYPQYHDVNIVNVFSEAIFQWWGIIEVADTIWELFVL